MRKGYLVWWCGGHQDERGAPDIQDDSYIAGLVVFCSGCGRVAPDQNGCRWRHEAELKVAPHHVAALRRVANQMMDEDADSYVYRDSGTLELIADLLESLLPPKEQP